jgi:hypothetical protein
VPVPVPVPENEGSKCLDFGHGHGHGHGHVEQSGCNTSAEPLSVSKQSLSGSTKLLHPDSFPPPRVPMFPQESRVEASPWRQGRVCLLAG